MQNIQDSFPLRQPEKAHLQSYKTAWLLFGGVLLSLQTPRQEPAEVPAASTPPAVGPGCPLATSPPAACRDARVPACLWPGAPQGAAQPCCGCGRAQGSWERASQRAWEHIPLHTAVREATTACSLQPLMERVTNSKLTNSKLPNSKPTNSKPTNSKLSNAFINDLSSGIATLYLQRPEDFALWRTEHEEDGIHLSHHKTWC